MMIESLRRTCSCKDVHNQSSHFTHIVTHRDLVSANYTGNLGTIVCTMYNETLVGFGGVHCLEINSVHNHVYNDLFF